MRSKQSARKSCGMRQDLLYHKQLERLKLLRENGCTTSGNQMRPASLLNVDTHLPDQQNDTLSNELVFHPIFDLIQEQSPAEKSVQQDQFSTKKHFMQEDIVKKTGACKRSLSSTSGLQEMNLKRLKKEEISCKKFINNHDNDVLLQILSEKVDGEKMLIAYKKNRTKEEVEEETSKILELNPKKEQHAFLALIPSLITINAEFSKLIPDDIFMKTILETNRDKLQSSKITELLDKNDLKEATCKKLTDEDLLDILFKRKDLVTYEKILKRVPDNAIFKQVELRKNSNTSTALLNVLLENFSKAVPQELNLELQDSVLVEQDSQTLLINNVTSLVNSRSCLNKSEKLLNIMLQKGPDMYSDVTKENIKSVLQKKFSADEFNDLSYAVTKFHLAERNTRNN